MVMASNPHRFIFDNVDILGTSGNEILISTGNIITK